MRFDRKKAAEYYVVAFVKNWSLRTYLNAIGNGEEIPFDKAHEFYPWLPSDVRPFLCRQFVRPWTARAMRPINDAIWDADTPQKKLAVAKIIETWVSDKVANQRSADEKERDKAKRDYQKSRFEARLFKEHAERSGGHHWGVVK